MYRGEEETPKEKRKRNIFFQKKHELNFIFLMSPKLQSSHQSTTDKNLQVEKIA